MLFACVCLMLALLLWLGLTQGPSPGGTFASVNSDVGDNAFPAWVNPNDAVAEDGTSVAFADGSGGAFSQLAAKIIKGDSPTGTNQSTGAALNTSALTFIVYGGAANLMGATLTAEDVNDATFGFAIAFVSGFGNGTKYLKFTNFGFTVPTGSTIDGVTAGMKCQDENHGLYGHRPLVDYGYMTINYTEAAGDGVVGRGLTTSLKLDRLSLAA